MSHDHKEGSVASYILIALILGVITYIEFAIVEYEISWLTTSWTFFWLAALSVVKFFLVIWFFMHLKDDNKTYTGFFSSGMVIAIGTFIALSFLFTGRSVSFARNQIANDTHAVAEGGHGDEAVSFAEGEHLFEEACVSCHSVAGYGIENAVPPYAVHMAELAQVPGGRNYMIQATLFGLEGEINVLGKTYNGVMPSFKSHSNEEIAAVLNYITQAWGNDALLPEDFEPFSAQDVADIRDLDLRPNNVHAVRSELNLANSSSVSVAPARTMVALLDTPEPKVQTSDLRPEAMTFDTSVSLKPETLVFASAQNGDALEAPASDEAPAEEAAPEAESTGDDVSGDDTQATADEATTQTSDAEVTADADGETATSEATTQEAAADESAQADAEEASVEDTAEADADAEASSDSTTEAAAADTTEASDETADSDAEAAETAQVAAFDWQELGDKTYGANCVACHQPNGQGVPAAFPPLAGHMPELYNVEGGREYIINVVLYGLQGAIEIDGQTYNSVMTPWAQLSDEEIAATLNHELTSWGNADAVDAFEPIMPDEVAALRGQNLSAADVYALREGLALE